MIALTNAAGQLEYCYDFAPYGDSDSKACAGGQFGTPPSPWGFAGAQYDVAQRLYKMGERYYDPNIGRWLQQDPIDQTGDQFEGNPYGYVGGDPINNIDPTGTDIFDDIDDISSDVTKVFNEYVRDPLRTRGGRCLLGGAIYGGVAFKLSKDPRIGAGAAIVGCGLGLANKGF